MGLFCAISAVLTGWHTTRTRLQSSYVDQPLEQGYLGLSLLVPQPKQASRQAILDNSHSAMAHDSILRSHPTLIPRLFPSLHRFLASPLSCTSFGGHVNLSLPSISSSQVLSHWIVVSPLHFVVFVQNASLEGIQHSLHSLHRSPRLCFPYTCLSSDTGRVGRYHRGSRSRG